MRRILTATLAGVVLVTASAWTQAPAASKHGDWLFGVSATSSTSAWAVGYFIGQNAVPQTLIERWDGRSWQQVDSPDPSPGYDEFSAVSADSGKDAWAVGVQKDASGTSDCLTSRWSGEGWAVVSDATAGLRNCRLTAVTAISTTNAWAVGTYQRLIPGKDLLANLSLIEHWNGRSWELVANPNPGGSTGSSLTDLDGVATLSPKDIWAVGDESPHLGRDPERTVTEHWNGEKWVAVASISPGSDKTSSFLVSVAATSKSAWAVGLNGIGGPYIERLAGGQWRKAGGPVIQRKFNGLASIAITSATSVWAVGFSATRIDGQQQPWIVHWNGSQWRAVPAPHPGGKLFTVLNAVTAPSPAATWAVGTIGHTILNDSPVTLIEHWTGSKWVRVTSPNPHA
jgi:hypothetical protein